MAFSNWVELAALLLVAATGTVLWRVCRSRLQRNDGFEGVIKERGKLPARRRLDVEEEIECLEAILGKK